MSGIHTSWVARLLVFWDIFSNLLYFSTHIVQNRENDQFAIMIRPGGVLLPDFGMNIINMI